MYLNQNAGNTYSFCFNNLLVILMLVKYRYVKYCSFNCVRSMLYYGEIAFVPRFYSVNSKHDKLVLITV